MFAAEAYRAVGIYLVTLRLGQPCLSDIYSHDCLLGMAVAVTLCRSLRQLQLVSVVSGMEALLGQNRGLDGLVSLMGLKFYYPDLKFSCAVCLCISQHVHMRAQIVSTRAPACVFGRI